MYTAWLTDNSEYPNAKCFYDNSIDDENFQLIDPTVDLEANGAGQFTFTLPPNHPFSGRFNPYTSIVLVVRDGTVIFEGRVIDENCDFWNTKQYACEGALAYLNDSIQPYKIYKEKTPLEFMTAILTEHNKFFIDNGEYYKCIFPGLYNMKFDNNSESIIMDQEDSTTNYENTMSAISKLVESYGGYIYITWNEKGEKQLNWVHEDTLIRAEQTIEFGSNLLDYTHDWDITEICTAVIPLGAKKRDGEGNETEERITIGSVNNDDIVVKHQGDMIKKFGLIVKTLEYDDISEPSQLLELGKKYLNSEQFEKMSIEISAYDMAMMNPKVEWEPPIKEVEEEESSS